MVPVRVRRQCEIDVRHGVSLVGKRRYRRSQHSRKLRDGAFSDVDADTGIHDERGRGMRHHEGRQGVIDPSRISAPFDDQSCWDGTRHLSERRMIPVDLK